MYGIIVYDYDSSALTQKWNNSDGKIEGSVVIYDIDRDNEYELIYTTSDVDCAAGKTCYNRVYIRNASNGALEHDINTNIYPRVAPAIANLDSDSNLEIVILGSNSEFSSYYTIQCYDANTENKDCEYDQGGSLSTIIAAPNIADIDGDGNYDIIFSETTTKVRVLNGDGTNKFSVNLEGNIGSSPVIGDLDDDGIAEIAVKRAGSPISVITFVTGFNQKPFLDQIDNITTVAGDLININESGELSAFDFDNDNLTFYFNSPFNESGLWQSTINDTGNYSILIEASDGNLSDYKYVDLIVFNSTTNVTDTFADGETKKSLNFTGAENKTVYVRLLKNASVIYSEINIEGLAS